MRFDPDLGRLEVSVRELAYRDRRPGVATTFGRLRREIGHVVHERHRRARKGLRGPLSVEPAGSVETEVPLRLERQVDGVSVVVRGRADVVVREGDGWVVEEVKSVVATGPLPEEDLRCASLQARVYALALEHEGRSPVTVRLVLASFEGNSDVVPLAYDRRAVEGDLDTALRALLERARDEAAEAARRRVWAEALVFPHAVARPGQAELLDALGGALRAGRPALVDAPTGTGKTVVALLAALREALGRGAAVWYLTAKTTQREAVMATFEAIVAASGGPPLRALSLRRKEAMCPPGDLACHPDRCPFLADFEARAAPVIEALTVPGALSPDAVFERGRVEGLCPYELMHALVEGADLIVGDYHHVYDRGRTRAFAGRRLVVIDEAHNLVDRARELASAFVSRRALRVIDDEIGRPIREAIDAALAVAAEEEREGHGGCAPAELDRERWSDLALEAGLAALRHAHAQHLRGEASAKDPILEVLESVGKLGELVGESDPDLAGYVASPTAPSGAGVGVICLDASRRLERQHRGELGLVAMSATLAPLDYYREVLGLGRLEPWLCSAPSSFPAENRCVSIVPTIRTTLAERATNAPAIARLVDRVVAVRPGNYAVFFPSFRYLAEVRGHLTASGFAVVLQPPTATETLREQIVASLRRADRPTLLFAVAGGIFAEGIDLVGEALIGAIVVGPCLPAADFERRLMTAHHDERREAGFAYAMAYPGMQRVVQAAGRVHRSPDDRGVIVLVGARFAESPFYEAIPPHWYDHRPEELFCDDPVPRLRRFWRPEGR